MLSSPGLEERILKHISRIIFIVNEVSDQGCQSILEVPDNGDKRFGVPL